MRPILFTIGNFSIRSYILFYTIAAIVMVLLAVKRAPRFGVRLETMLDATIVSILSMFVGSRLWYSVLYRDQFLGHWRDILNPLWTGGGLASVGGAFSLVFAVTLYARLKQCNLRAIVDAGAPGWLLANAIARVGGCFLAGCCAGVPTDSVWGVVFPPSANNPFPPETAVWPTQLFYAAVELLGFFLVLWLERRFTTPGATFLCVCGWYTLDRFLVGQLRYYSDSQIIGLVGPLRIDWNVPILSALTLFSLALYISARRSRQPTPPSQEPAA